jgi:hypothetical protein
MIIDKKHFRYFYCKALRFFILVRRKIILPYRVVNHQDVILTTRIVDRLGIDSPIDTLAFTLEVQDSSNTLKPFEISET